MKYHYLLSFLFALICSVATTQTVERLYLQIGTPNSMVVMWRTSNSTDSKIWYGDSPTNLTDTIVIAGSRSDHEVHVQNLLANTTYYYAVGSSGGQLQGGNADHYFKTSPTTGAQQPMTIWVLGDCGTGNSNQKNVRDMYYNYIGNGHTDVMLLLGDNAYNDGTQSEYQDHFFDIYPTKLINSVVWPTIGNHDYGGSSGIGVPYYDIFTIPTDGEAGGLASNTETYYSFDYGNVHFVTMDSHDGDRSAGSPMFTWLENDLAATLQPWIVVYFHHPPHGNGTHDSDSDGKMKAMRENAMPICEAYGVDLVLTGHNHRYQRSFNIHNFYGKSTDYDPAIHAVDGGDGRVDGDGAYQQNGLEEGTVYITTGSAGRQSGTGTQPVMYTTLNSLGSTVLEVNGNTMDIKFLNDNGVVEDYLTLINMEILGDPPTVDLTLPVNGAHFGTPQTITIQATANDPDGTVDSVKFYVDNVEVGIDLASPYMTDWTIPADGGYTLRASVWDNDENMVNSANVGVSVGALSVCSRVATGNDDAEERTSNNGMYRTSSDLELVFDGSKNQVIGLRFTDINIPQGATITSANVQFTVDESNNSNPCDLTFYGEYSGNSQTFGSSDHDITSRVLTDSSITWSPSNWTSVGAAGADQLTSNLAGVVEEVISHPDWDAASALVLIIDGTGKRVAESYNGSSANAPEICIEYSLVTYDCPNLGANIGDPCEDIDLCTTGDTVTVDCECVGVLQGDSDNDGVCNPMDICNGSAEPDTPCDDSDPCTINDLIQSDCSCAGLFVDSDGDGTCDVYDDCNGSPEPFEACDDGDPCTGGDAVQPDCTCVGVFEDDDGDGVCNASDICTDFDDNLIGQVCDDGDPNTIGETYTINCICESTVGDTLTVCHRVASSTDDAEERISINGMDITSSDLELVFEGSHEQEVGVRFTGMDIPQGSVILNAHIQFTVDETGNANPCNLTFYGEYSENSVGFSSTAKVTDRTKTNNLVGWVPPDWVNIGDAGADQQTPDLSIVVQEMVDHPQWDVNSPLTFIISGEGERVAESYNGSISKAPELCIEYIDTSPANLRRNVGGFPEYQKHIRIFSVPTVGDITVYFDSDEQGDSDICVYDIYGRVVAVVTHPIGYGDNLVSILGNDIIGGMYFVHIKFPSGSVGVEKVTVAR